MLRSAHTSTGRHESTAEHSWRLCLVALTFADLLGPLDLGKVLKLCVVHDLGEAIHGDIPAIDPAAHAGGKSARERRDLLQIARTLPPAVRDELVALWDEYDAAATREARVVKALDKVETILQHHVGANPPGFDHGFNLTYGRAYVAGDPVLEALRERVDAATRERMAHEAAFAPDPAARPDSHPRPMSAVLAPPVTDPNDVVGALSREGRAVLAPEVLAAVVDVALPQLDALRPSWDDLPPDGYLRDGGRYRRRRHACYVVDGDAVRAVPGRPHWQPVEYNALHGGLERWFEPVDAVVASTPAWSRLLVALSAVCSAVTGPQPWFVEAHQFRIDTTDGIGRPTPEGAHRDGVDFVAVVLVGREGIKGGETRVFDADGPAGLRFTMTAPWTTLLLDDQRVIHESTPIQPIADAGHRDTLVLTFRSGGFQGPGA